MNPFRAFPAYIRGVGTEVKKVSWPAFPVLVQHFFSVVIGLALATAFIWAVDYLFIHMLTFFISK